MGIRNTEDKDRTAFGQEQAWIQAARLGAFFGQVGHLTMPPQGQPVLVNWSMGRRVRRGDAGEGKPQTAGLRLDGMGQGERLGQGVGVPLMLMMIVRSTPKL